MARVGLIYIVHSSLIATHSLFGSQPACLFFRLEDWQTQFFHGPITENKSISLYLHIFRDPEIYIRPVKSYVSICVCFFLPLVTVERSALCH